MDCYMVFASNFSWGQESGQMYVAAESGGTAITLRATMREVSVVRYRVNCLSI
jgi:hypothetical protein